MTRRRAAGEQFILQIVLANGMTFAAEYPEKTKAQSAFHKVEEMRRIAVEGKLIQSAELLHFPMNSIDQPRILETTAEVKELREDLPKGEDRRKSEHMARLDKGRDIPNAPEKPKSAKQPAA